MPTGDSSGGTEKSRRSFLREAVGVGALGTLAGCQSQPNTESNGGDTPTGNGDTNTGSTTTSTSQTTGSGGSKSITISFLSAFAAANQGTNHVFNEGMKQFEDRNRDLSVNLNKASYDDIRNKLSSTVSSGNAPTLAESGAIGLEYFLQDRVPDHGSWIESEEGLPDKWLPVNKTIANFRGNWWTSGTIGIPGNSFGIRPKLFSQVGVSDPFSELDTWSKTYDVLQRINDELSDVVPWEETGQPNDLESYWGEARTSHTGGKDPWIRGDPSNPDVQIGNNPRTDGMIKNCVKLANEFSSTDAPSRTNEEIPALLLTGRVASFPHIQNSFTEWTSVKEDVKFGWQDGQGDVMMIPFPRLDAEYGSKIGISELEGIEGEHGGHVWGLENAHTVFDVGDQQKMDAGWKLAMFLQKDEDFMLNLIQNGDPVIPTFTPLTSKVDNSLDLPQPYTQLKKQIQEFGSQYNNTGAPWDVRGTAQIRWTDINETISQSMAGQIDVESLPGEIRNRVTSTLEEQNS